MGEGWGEGEYNAISTTYIPLPSNIPLNRHSGESRNPACLCVSACRQVFSSLPECVGGQTIWTPVFTGVTTFYEFILFDNVVKNPTYPLTVIPAAGHVVKR